MTESLDRDDLIRLLEQLGGEEDEQVLEAARELHAQVTSSGMDWDALLADVSAAEGGADDNPAPVSAGGDDNVRDTLTLIDKLLAGSGRSDSLREELEEYKADIANGEFEARDHEYVRALYARLAK